MQGFLTQVYPSLSASRFAISASNGQVSAVVWPTAMANVFRTMTRKAGRKERYSVGEDPGVGGSRPRLLSQHFGSDEAMKLAVASGVEGDIR
jgi:hypothetical protein